MNGEIAPRSALPSAWIVALCLVACVPIVAAYGLYAKTDRFALEPGPATDVTKLVHINGTTKVSKGELLITTVSVTLDTINMFENLRAGIDPVITTVPKSALIQPGLSNQQQDQLNQADMEESKYAASVAAVAAAGREVALIPGVDVIKVFDETPAAAAGIKEGDVITSINGKQVKNVDEMTAAIRESGVGKQVSIELTRDGSSKTITVKTASDPANPSHPIIGVRPGPAFKLPVSVTIDSQEIVGPSGGLVFSLAITNALSNEDLTRGHKIAVTGTIDLNGQVGPIGGIEQKVHGAEYVGADTFICPANEAADARKAAGHMKVFGVADIAQAVSVLRGLPQKR